MTRTTISLHESTLHKVKKLSRQGHSTLGETITELLNIGLNQKRIQLKTTNKKFTLPSFSLGKTKVPLEDKEAVYSLLDEGS
jgi:hypothetical protein